MGKHIVSSPSEILNVGLICTDNINRLLFYYIIKPIHLHFMALPEPAEAGT